MRAPTFAISVPLLLLGASACGTSPEFREEVVEETVSDYVPTGSLKSLVGEWKGNGTQGDGTSWDIELSVTSDRPGRCATIRYPTSGCSGHWVCLGAFDGVQLDAVEHITAGRDRCIDQVDVQLVVDEGSRTVSFFADAGTVNAEGQLQRK